jgi:hypothetical protein
VNKVYLEILYDHHHTKNGNSSNPEKFEMEELYNHQFEPRSKIE